MIVPTQLLEHADGGSSRGWSTMYDMQILSKYYVATGSESSTEMDKIRATTSMIITSTNPKYVSTHAGNYFSPLLVAGQINA